ncbi:type II toxin-antitoxin system RelE/ParE family toxin [Sediminibacterium sp.]|uniref:type II toxin-antitoxin system RelE family toxin n=1 Tax=Sediminibacterium sp. TaxID=1917865 RepID=UPI003421CBFF
MPHNKEEKKQKPKYTVFILPSVQKQIDKLPNNTATRIEDKMMELESDPRPSGCKKLKGRNAYRIRIGDYRAIYDIIDNKLIITVINIAHRKDVYQ